MLNRIRLLYFIHQSSKTHKAVYIRSLWFEAEPQSLSVCFNAGVKKHRSHSIAEISQPRHIKTPREEAEGDDV